MGVVPLLLRRSDLAQEAKTIWSEENIGALEGVREEEFEKNGFRIVKVHITGDRAAEELCKPKGVYVTVELGRFLRREDQSFAGCAQVIGEILSRLLPRARDPAAVEGTVLVVGLGNPAVTPDAVGHLVLKSTLITRHLLRQMPREFASLSSVAAVEPGVLGTTGLESADVVSAVARELRPAAVIAVDALASRSMDRVCRTVQISDTGIVPGSGVGNARAALSRETLGVPVIALGVPTVVDAATLALDMAREAGADLDAQALRPHAGRMIVTPREIDASVAAISRLMGYGINMALHPGLTVQDIDALIC